VDRRSFLKALGGVAGGLVVQQSVGFKALGATLTGLPDATGASRLSKLGGSLFVVHSDLHNHSLISGDAEGEPYAALGAIKARGIDVACMTEHAVSGKDHGQYTCPTWQDGGCRFAEGINANDWATMATIADQGYEPGTFVSFRGFEYSTPTIGHINVWFGQDFTDPAHEEALATPRAVSEMWRVFGPQTKPVADQFQNAPDIAQITPFYEWLTSTPGTFPLGGGNDAIAGFNHPGYFGNFQDFLFHAGAAQYMTLIEAFNPINSDADYFWYGADRGVPNPFNACFNAGWRVGFTGVSDEHSGVYGQPNKGRGGLWVSALTREGVRGAMASKRTFATLEPALRLDATADDVAMGSSMPAPSKPVTILLDIARDPAWVGKDLVVEVVGPGPTGGLPNLIDLVPIKVPSDRQPPAKFKVRPEGSWLFLRIIDPERPNHALAKPPFNNGGAFAYASPWFLD
jgi:hypothetical protein